MVQRGKARHFSRSGCAPLPPLTARCRCRDFWSNWRRIYAARAGPTRTSPCWEWNGWGRRSESQRNPNRTSTGRRWPVLVLRANSKAGQQCLYLFLDPVADRAELLPRKIPRIRDRPIFTAAGPDPWAVVPATHRDRDVILDIGQLCQTFRALRLQIDAALAHEFDGTWVDPAGGPRAGAVDLDRAAMQTSKRLGHLAAVAVLDTDEQQPFGDRATRLRHGLLPRGWFKPRPFCRPGVAGGTL